MLSRSDLLAFDCPVYSLSCVAMASNPGMQWIAEVASGALVKSLMSSLLQQFKSSIGERCSLDSNTIQCSYVEAFDLSINHHCSSC